jgi:hypothetical protein
MIYVKPHVSDRPTGAHCRPNAVSLGRYSIEPGPGQLVWLADTVGGCQNPSEEGDP